MAVKVDQHERGYVPFRSTVVRESRYHDKAQVDYYEAFIYGTNYDVDDPNVVAGTRLFGTQTGGLTACRTCQRQPLLIRKAWTGSVKACCPCGRGRSASRPDYFSPFFEHAHGYCTAGPLSAEAGAGTRRITVLEPIPIPVS